MKAIRNQQAEIDRKSDFDALAWTRRRRDAMYEATRGMSVEELVAYVRKAAAPASGPSKPASASGPT
jgi:hypothetical protein